MHDAANDSLRVNGIGRDAEDERTLILYFNERPGDDDMRRIHDLLRDGAAPSLQPTEARCHCPCCTQGIPAPHEYHLEQRPMASSPSAQQERGPADLLSAAKLFYNLTIADPAVIIRPRSQEKRDAIVQAGERLRAAIGAAPGAQEPTK